MSITKQDLSKRLETIFPEINTYGLNMELEYDSSQHAWMATFRTGDHTLSTHLEEEDVQRCLQGQECYHLGIQLGQFIRNFCEGGGACTLGHKETRQDKDPLPR